MTLFCLRHDDALLLICEPLTRQSVENALVELKHDPLSRLVIIRYYPSISLPITATKKLFNRGATVNRRCPRSIRSEKMIPEGLRPKYSVRGPAKKQRMMLGML